MGLSIIEVNEGQLIITFSIEIGFATNNEDGLLRALSVEDFEINKPLCLGSPSSFDIELRAN